MFYSIFQFFQENCNKICNYPVFCSLHEKTVMKNKPTNNFRIYDTIIQETAAKVQIGATILYPSDTMWGLGCDATDPKTVEKLYKLKGGNRDKPFLILVNCIEMLKQYVENIHPRIETLLVYHKRPITFIYPNAKNLPDIALGKDKSVGIRLCQDDFCNQLIESIGKPLISTSANLADEPSPKFFNEISERIKSKVDYIVDYRQNDMELKEPSIIAKYDDMGEIHIIRG